MASFTIKPGDADTYLRSDAAGVNYGLQDDIYLGWLTKDDELRALLRVDFSADIPAGATINTATLYMSCGNVNEGVAGIYWGYRVKVAWDEGDGSPNQNANWNERVTGTAWQAGGCRGANDYDSGVSFGSWAVGSAGWKSVDVVTFLQDAVTNRSRIFDAVLNNTAVLGEGENSYHSFHSKDYANADYHWYITGTYTAAAPGGSRNRGYVLGSKLRLPSLPQGWLRRRGLLVPVGA